MLRLLKPIAPLLISALALVPGPLHGLASSPTKVASRPEPTLITNTPPSALQINVAEAAAGAYRLQLAKFYKGIETHNEAVWYQGARDTRYKAYLTAVIANDEAAAAKKHAALISEQVVNTPPVPTGPPTQSFGNLSGVVQCIKNHESGNYYEHSHPGSGSGAYQFIPGTWQTWSARAGYGGYSLAYLAPPSVQDAVLMYTLTHGGAGNWSNQWGNDPCTAGL